MTDIWRIYHSSIQDQILWIEIALGVSTSFLKGKAIATLFSVKSILCMTVLKISVFHWFKSDSVYHEIV